MLIFTSPSWRSSIFKSLPNTTVPLKAGQREMYECMKRQTRHQCKREHLLRREKKYILPVTWFRMVWGCMRNIYRANFMVLICNQPFFKDFNLVGNNLSYYIMISGERHVLTKLKLACGPGILDLSMSLYTFVLGKLSFFWGSSF